MVSRDDDVHQIHCTAQQSRFHVDTLDSSREIDLHDVTITVGKRQNERILLQHSHVRIKHGVKYALVGRNGTGKSTLLQALSNKLIPGINTNLNVCLLSQIEQHENVISDETNRLSVLEHVIRGDKRALKAEQRCQTLSKAIEATDLQETQDILLKLTLEDKQEELEAARLIAQRRSGSRGKLARTNEIEAEANVAKAQQALQVTTDPSQAPLQAAQLLQQAQEQFELASFHVFLSVRWNVTDTGSSAQLNGPTREARARSILSGLGFSQSLIDSPIRELSGGWKSRASLAIALLIDSDVLLLDECTNFLDLPTIVWLERFLSEQTQSLVIVSHDQEFLCNIVDETIELRDQTLRYFEGNPAAFQLEQRKKFLSATKTQNALDRKRDHMEKSIQQAISTAKRTGDENKQKMAKSRQRKLDERFGLETNSKGFRFKVNRDMMGKHLTRRQAVEIESPDKSVRIKLDDPNELRSSGNLLNLDGVCFRRQNQNQFQLENINLTLSLSSRVAILGPNGVGKSTLARLMMGQLVPTKGTITRHSQARIAFFAQESVEQLSLDAQQRINEETGQPFTALSYLRHHAQDQGHSLTEQEARACLSAMGLQGKIVTEVPVSLLSGGQKVRLALCLIFYHPPHLVILDEPSTHLDFDTVLAFAQALRSYKGGVVIITHDRWLSRVVVQGQSIKSARRELASMSGLNEQIEQGNDDDDEDDDDGQDSEQESIEPGQTFRIVKGSLKQIDGVDDYVKIVQKKVAKSWTS
ncbi:hypothetical protein OIO90_003016 [Microbotryomycetes sp. JL221]|nr:hypothetical protein OIO90_003016 [Microbotryomycetes sp. JL221]